MTDQSKYYIGFSIIGPAPVVDKHGNMRDMMDVVNENSAGLKHMREEGKENTRKYKNLMRETLLLLRDTPTIETPVWPNR
jgi:hypothetical protein